MRIRQASTADITEIVELSDQLGYPTNVDLVSHRLAEILNKPEHVVWIAELESGAVVGWVHVTRTTWLEIDPFAEIGGLVVDAAHRSQGIGKALLDKAEAWALENSLSSLRVRSNVIRSRAHHFYEEAGYNIIKSQHVFEKKLRN
ncbi:MAG: hypothetical protein A2Z16_00420 [Chloroflexi bacterium RBG_16_54_18]|nr:MAG: hypothetical protein A2Z16_00420 [Chloroflexi bacterium RBG_16_54_18]